LENPGEVVSREELRQRLWPGDTFVEFDDNLNHAVKTLREALTDSAEQPRFVETLPRHGYRFIAPVEVPEVPGPDETEGAEARGRARSRWLLALALVALPGLLAVLLALNVAGLRDLLLGRIAPSEISSLAVLPLDNLSGDPDQDFFADGMTEALITELGKVGALRVISRQSVMQYKGSDKPLPEIARELNVDAVVEGSAVREGDRVRITVQLVLAEPEEHLWAESYERNLSSLIALQGQIARTVAGEVRAALTPEEQARLARAQSVDPEAQILYLKGRYHFNKLSDDSLGKALDYFQQAIEKDPNYAAPYAGLADCYVQSGGTWLGLSTTEAYSQAKEAALKALELDEALPAAHLALAAGETNDWYLANAERHYRHAITLNPSYADAYLMLSDYLYNVGRTEEAIQVALEGRRLNPLSIPMNIQVGYTFYYARQPDRAIQELRATIELDPSYARAYYGLGRAFLAKGMFTEAIEAFEKGVALAGNPPKDLLAHAYARAGNEARARELLEETINLQSRGYARPFHVARIYVGLGDNNKAMEWLERGYREEDPFLTALKADLTFDPLRDDPRFQSLLRRMNFPD
jgi:TolB-like protein